MGGGSRTLGSLSIAALSGQTSCYFFFLLFSHLSHILMRFPDTSWRGLSTLLPLGGGETPLSLFGKECVGGPSFGEVATELGRWSKRVFLRVELLVTGGHYGSTGVELERGLEGIGCSVPNGGGVGMTVDPERVYRAHVFSAASLSTASQRVMKACPCCAS
ncbi:hypothetical protein JZ751_027175 [Albula glossodonta]|uniref:Uncharacterized protein n=1 Tax=Albula glossodonta TaxID=121402 RepID=A0A8T2MSI5_9TELE|nr:hypothetical protein JZ751_027175 [Albula glossodonta]